MLGQRLLYNHIFFTNVLRILSELHMTKHELSEKSGVSISFLSDLTTGKANPSLKVMESIAKVLETPLPLLLEMSDLDPATLELLAGDKVISSVPPGYQRVCAILPEYRAFLVRQWAEEARKKLQRQ